MDIICFGSVQVSPSQPSNGSKKGQNVRKASALMCFVLVFALALGVFAQAPTGVITGTLTDQSAAAIPNATVTITEKATGTVRTITTNNAGLYSAPALLAGEY